MVFSPSDLNKKYERATLLLAAIGFLQFFPLKFIIYNHFTCINTAYILHLQSFYLKYSITLIKLVDQVSENGNNLL